MKPISALSTLAQLAVRHGNDRVRRSYVLLPYVRPMSVADDQARRSSIAVKAVLVVALALASPLAFSQQSRVPDSVTEEYGVFRSGSPVFASFRDHYVRSARAFDPVQGRCEAQLTVTREGFLAGIQLDQCPSEEVRQAVYVRLLAADPYPPMPNPLTVIVGWF